MKKLLLCSGPTDSPYGNDGWFRVDGKEEFRPDFVSELPPIPKEVADMGPWDRIALIHGIEHFYVWDAFALVQQCLSLLSNEGELILEQPDLQKCCEYFDSPQSILGIYGYTGSCDPAMAHRFGYTPHMLTNLVKRAGFEEVRIERPLFHNIDRDFRLVAIKKGFPENAVQ